MIGRGSQALGVTFKTTNALPLNGTIQLTFPERFVGLDSAGKASSLWYLNEANYTLQSFKVNGVDKLSAITHTLTMQSGKTQLLTITLASTGNLPALSQIELVLTEFNNPI